MAPENDIKKELLKQMDKNSNQRPKANIMSPLEIISKDMARVQRLKWITIFSWLLVVMLFVIGGIIETAVPYKGFPDAELKAVGLIILPVLTVVLKALIFISIFFTIALYVRSRTLSIKKIHTRLSNIEEQLKRISQDK